MKHSPHVFLASLAWLACAAPLAPSPVAPPPPPSPAPVTPACEHPASELSHQELDEAARALTEALLRGRWLDASRAPARIAVGALRNKSSRELTDALVNLEAKLQELLIASPALHVVEGAADHTLEGELTIETNVRGTPKGPVEETVYGIRVRVIGGAGSELWQEQRRVTKLAPLGQGTCPLDEAGIALEKADLTAAIQELMNALASDPAFGVSRRAKPAVAVTVRNRSPWQLDTTAAEGLVRASLASWGRPSSPDRADLALRLSITGAMVVSSKTCMSAGLHTLTAHVLDAKTQRVHWVRSRRITKCR